VNRASSRDRSPFINSITGNGEEKVEGSNMSIEVLRIIKVRANLEPTFREQLMRSPLKFLQEYDLTEEEKRQIILPNFGWLLENKLAAMAYPESEDAFTLLDKIGIRAILNLSEMPLPYETPNKIGMLARHIPIAGFTAPTLDQVKQAVAMITSCLDRHMPVAVHCIAGLGRTGTILACYLVGMEIPANNAIIIVREWRAGSIEVPEQEAAVYEYERFINTRV
jgi:atypical dual specificity phosphatase